ncbi:MAG TPA: hypothetical protein VHR86_09820 [Armatimonadota bacterium]|nr:hypothetical protein [Armatimonadota bacterium]
MMEQNAHALRQKILGKIALVLQPLRMSAFGLKKHKTAKRNGRAPGQQAPDTLKK